MFDFQEITKSALSEASKDFEKNLSDRMKNIFTNALRMLFLDPHECQEYKEKKIFQFHKNNAVKEKDMGLMFNIVSNQLTDVIFDEKWNEFSKDYIEKNFQAALEKALDKAMAHKANKIAFEKVKQENIN